MPTSEIKAYYQHGEHAGESYLRDRFARPGGRAVSERELELGTASIACLIWAAAEMVEPLPRNPKK